MWFWLEQVTEMSLFSLLAGPCFESSEEGRSTVFRECRGFHWQQHYSQSVGRQARRREKTQLQVSPNRGKQQPLNTGKTRLHEENGFLKSCLVTAMESIMNWQGVSGCTGLRSPPADCLQMEPGWGAGTEDKLPQVEKTSDTPTDHDTLGPIPWQWICKALYPSY